MEELRIPTARGDENGAIPTNALDHLANTSEHEDISLPAPRDTTNSGTRPVSRLEGKTEIPDSDADSEFSSPVKSTSNLHAAVTASSPIMPNEDVQSSEGRTLVDRDIASINDSLLLAVGSTLASNKYETSAQDTPPDLATGGIYEVIEIEVEAGTAKEVDSVINPNSELPVITSSSTNEADASHMEINALDSSLSEVKPASKTAESVLTSSPMNEVKAANAISFAAAAIGTLQEPETADEDDALDFIDSFSENVQKAIEFINQRPLSTSLPELELFKTGGGHTMENSQESSAKTSSLPTSALPTNHGAEDQEMETGIESANDNKNLPARPILVQQDNGDQVMEDSDETSTTVGILASSAVEPDLKEEPTPTPANSTNNDSQHFDEAWKEIMGTDKVPGSSHQSTQNASSQATRIIEANGLDVSLASVQLIRVGFANAKHGKHVDAVEDIRHERGEDIEIPTAIHQTASKSSTKDGDTPMNTGAEFAPQQESDEPNMSKKPDTLIGDVRESTPLFEGSSSKTTSFSPEYNHQQSPAQDIDMEMAEEEDDGQAELGTSQVPILTAKDLKQVKNVPEEIRESQTSRKRVIPDSDEEDEDEQGAEGTPVLPLARESSTRAASPGEATLSIAPILSQSTQPEDSLIPSSPRVEAILLPSQKPVKTPSAPFKLSTMNTDSLLSSPVRPETSSSFVTKAEEQTSRASEGSKDVVMEELKAMKIASLKARNAALIAEIESERAKLGEVTKTLIHPAAETVKTHIKLLHDYNDIRDIGQGLIGMIADNRGVRIGDLYEEFGVDVKD